MSDDEVGRLRAEVERERQRAEYWKARAKSVAGQRHVQNYKRMATMLSQATMQLTDIRGFADHLLAEHHKGRELGESALAMVLNIRRLAQRPPRPPRKSHREKA